MLKVVTFNVNSISVRLPIVLSFLNDEKPDILLLQELKCEEGKFPSLELKGAGYHSYILGQKAYNGVAILSKQPLSSIFTNLMPEDTAARYIEGALPDGTVVGCVYVPNGNPVPSEKLQYKLAFMEQLKLRFKRLMDEGRSFIIGGDYNVIYDEKLDVYNPKAFEGDALFHPEVRKMFRVYLNTGVKNALRVVHPDKVVYTWYSYMRGDMHNGNGILIDHFLVSPDIADRIKEVKADMKTRTAERPSDHLPLVMTLD